jgi:phosphoribosylaminoimidazolecarboxamide formyltransferase / IMP cyclohydrolase
MYSLPLPIPKFECMKSIQTALISVFHKEGLAPIVEALHATGVSLYSTGGTQQFIEELGIPVTSVESLTGYPSILDGRVKTLHPKVFGGILARREEAHKAQLDQFDIPEIDLVIVDLYPFADTVKETDDESRIIEKIDIGGISLIRAAAKNYKDVAIVASRTLYERFLDVFEKGDGKLSLEFRRELAGSAFQVSAAYDADISKYFSEDERVLIPRGMNKVSLRYGENPHQKGSFYGELDDMVPQIHGKDLSYNNLVDIDAAIGLMREFQLSIPTFAILKHTNSCGLASRPNLIDAWKDALAGDPVSAFGGVLISNQTISGEVAEEIDKIFYEVLLAPDFTEDALELLQKKNRILLRIRHFGELKVQARTLLNGAIEQDADLRIEGEETWELATTQSGTEGQREDLLFALKAVKHLKSNAIVLIRDRQIVGMGCGQTSRVDALKQAIDKARRLGLSLEGCAMGSDAFFPFPDCVEIGYEAGVRSIIQPGGSKNDKASIDACNERSIPMYLTGVRHFKH